MVQHAATADESRSDVDDESVQSGTAASAGADGECEERVEAAESSDDGEERASAPEWLDEGRADDAETAPTSEEAKSDTVLILTEERSNDARTAPAPDDAKSDTTLTLTDSESSAEESCASGERSRGESSGMTDQAVVTERQLKGQHQSESGDRLYAQINDASSRLASRQWEKAASVLRSNTSLMTGHILRLALHNRPPPHVIKFMLDLNPSAAAVPKSGPSALQVAVRHGASLEVVEQLIKACPYALFTGNGSYDPLTYAKIWRREEKDLIELLGRPISHWVKPGRKNRSDPEKDDAGTPSKGDAAARRRASRMSSGSALHREEQRELSNLKLITAAVVKSQRKHVADSARGRKETAAELHALELREKRARRDLIESVEERERKNMKAQLVALDMKERAFEAKMARLGRELTELLTRALERQEQCAERREARDDESRYSMEFKIVAMRDEILGAANRVERACSSYGTRLADLAARVDRESAWNAAFRNDVRTMQSAMEEKIESVAAEQSFFVHSSPISEGGSPRGVEDLQPLFSKSDDSNDNDSMYSDDWNVRSTPSGKKEAPTSSAWSKLKEKVTRKKLMWEKKRFFRLF